MLDYSPLQRQIIDSPLNSKLFVSGPAGAGKTTAGVERMRFLIEQGVPGESILMLTPQRTLQEPYLDLLYSPERRAGGEATPATIGGLARRMCDLFWPLVGEAAGFAFPDQPPAFLTLETAQYYMAHIVRPLLDVGYFESVTIDRNRLYSQIIDNLNKAAVIGFPHTEIGTRLDSSYFGDPAQRRVYVDAQDCANRFRQYCLDHNLLDFSLQLEIFMNVLWKQDIVRDYLVRTYHHLIYDNVEEDMPRAHDMLREWLPNFDSALLLYDEGGGFRQFLGADVQTGWALRELCDNQLRLNDSFVMSEAVSNLSAGLRAAILPEPRSHVEGVALTGAAASKDQESSEAFSIIQAHFYPELLDIVVNEVEQLLLNENLPPSEIVVLAPYLSDALRFSIMNRLSTRVSGKFPRGLPVRSHRPSRSLYDEPASRALITLAALSHPYWNIHPPKFDVAYAMMQALDGLDLVRAQLLTDIVYRQRDVTLSPFEIINPGVQERITFSVGNRYSTLRTWIDEYRSSNPLPLDHFLRKLFGEVLSQSGFGFHANIERFRALNIEENDKRKETKFDAVRVAASLVESVKKFRLAMDPLIVGKDRPDFDFGKEYIAMLGEGVIAASYLEGWQTIDKNAVLVAPAHTFLMMNRPATVQFWLDPGSSGWFERLSQPLTHPYVLSRGWEPGRQWSDADDVQYSKEAMARLISGLLHRCREHIYLGIAELGESGFEGRGELLRAFQKVITA